LYVVVGVAVYFGLSWLVHALDLTSFR